MSGDWGRHEVERLFGALDEELRWAANDAFIFFKGHGVDRKEIMPLLVAEWLHIQGAENYFKHERQKLVDAAVGNLPHAERIRVLLEDMTAAALETRESGIEDPTLPPLEAITGIELVRDVLEEYPTKTAAFLALYDLTIEEIEAYRQHAARVDRPFRLGDVLPSRAFIRRARRGSDRPSDWPASARVQTVRNCFNAFRKKYA